jgi:tetrahydromethanopterin S-methyltransferase subunit G
MEDNELIKTELAAMDQRLTELEEKIDNIDTKLTQVIDAILGNRLTKTGGFMSDIEIIKGKIDVLEKKQARYDDFKKKITWTIGIIVAIGLLIEYLTKVYSNVK